MTDFETYLIRQRGFTTKSAKTYAASLRAVEKLIGGDKGSENERERAFRRQARGSMSPHDISNCVSAMRAYADYASPQNV